MPTQKAAAKQRPIITDYPAICLFYQAQELRHGVPQRHVASLRGKRRRLHRPYRSGVIPAVIVVGIDVGKADAYQYRQGKPLDAIWGYECLGFFQDEADIKSSPNQSYFGQTIAPGDLKYKDQNNDGVIDNKDQVNLGKGGWYGAPSTLGINVTLKYKNFTLFMLGTGSFGGNGVRNNSYWWVKGEDKYSAAVRDRWTPETANTAAYPRLTTGNGANNYVTSDFWMYSTSRFDLNKVQLSYDFDKKLFGNSFVKGVQVYVSGNSLLTIAKEREILEMSVGSAPQTRFYNLGFKVAF